MAHKDEDAKLVQEFIKVVNDIREQHNAGPMSYNTALKFMSARKFDVHRALALYQAHELTRYREGLAKFDPNQEPLKSELETGKFTVLPSHDSSGATIAMFTANKHVPMDTSHQVTLQGVVFQMDIALEDANTQKSGIVFIYNMSGSKYANFDYELSQKILSLLKGAYPARLKKVLIVTAPLWFKAPFKILRLFVREKLRDRVFMVNVSQLPNHIPIESLPKEIGGQLDYDHKLWLDHCLKKTSTNELCDLASYSKFPLNATSQQQNGGAILNISCSSNGSDILSLSEHYNGKMSDDDDDDVMSCSLNSANKFNNESSIMDSINVESNHETINKPVQKPKPENIKMPPPLNANDAIIEDLPEYVPSSESLIFLNSDESVHKDKDDGMNVEDFIQYMKNKGRKGLYEEYNEIKRLAPVGLFETSRTRINQPKNRYTDVLCYDHSRVIITRTDEDDDLCTDYINANFVDGYMQKNAFISTQGPLPRTFIDFWQMIWQFEILVIVMTTRTVERCRGKCGQYWPATEEMCEDYGPFSVVNKGVEEFKDYIITSLLISDTRTGVTRSISHMQFTSWPDYGVPHSAVAMLDFRDRIREQQAKGVSAMGSWQGHHLGPPIVVHCSAGIGRTGTFITLDISILRLEAIGKIDIKTTVEKIRAQRAYSIQMPDQYVFCYLALLEYALSRGLLQDVDLSGFDSESDCEE